jgi:acyl dehydratase
VADKATVDQVETVRGPYFDELQRGQRFDKAPAVTLTDGLAAAHRAIVGNRLRLAQDHELARIVTRHGLVASPALVWDVAIGQSTVVTQHVKANLFYRGLAFRRFPEVGDTLTTVTTVEALRTNTHRPGRQPTGLAVLRIVTTDQLGRDVLDFWRCAMLPLADTAAAGPRDDTAAGPRDDLTDVGRSPNPKELAAAVSAWDLAAYRDLVPGEHFADLRVGSTWVVSGGDVVSSAPELARLTGNIAAVHHDAHATGGTRLVYGGHTIGLALHQLTRAIPALVTVTGWESCDHLAPMHEGQLLESTVTLEGLRPLSTGGGLARLRSEVTTRGDDGRSEPVLDWRLTGVLA